MTTTTLSASGLNVNPYVDYRALCHPLAMNSDLQGVFVRRLKEEMEARGLSANALARMCKKPYATVGYASISRILAGKQDPTLEKVDALSAALGLPAWALMTEASLVEQRIIRPPQNVVRLPDPYPRIFDKKPQDQTQKRAKRRR